MTAKAEIHFSLMRSASFIAPASGGEFQHRHREAAFAAAAIQRAHSNRWTASRATPRNGEGSNVPGRH